MSVSLTERKENRKARNLLEDESTEFENNEDIANT